METEEMDRSLFDAGVNAGDLINSSVATVEDAGYGGGIEDLRRHLRHKARSRLLAEINDLILTIKKPLADIVRDHALARLPVQSLRRLRAVSASWNRHIAAPFFAHTNAVANRTISGVFFSLPSAHCFAPFDPQSDAIPDPSLSFLPTAFVKIESSSHGLLLCLSAPRSTYYVCNPATQEWAVLPRPLAVGPSVAAVLVFEPDVYNFRADYDLVVAFKVRGAMGIYGFETFSSAAGAWWISSEVCFTEEIYDSSGVSAGGMAWWRTSMQTVVGYDPMSDRVRVVPWPVGHDEEAWWQLGGIDGRLCCTVVLASAAVMVYVLEPTDEWRILGSFEFMVFGERPWPLRFQSGNMEVMLAVGERVFGVDVASRKAREIQLDGTIPVRSMDFVSHINTLAPVFPQPVVDDVVMKDKKKEVL